MFDSSISISHAQDKSLPKIRRQHVLQASSVPGAEELQRLMFVGHCCHIFSKSCSKSNDNPKGKQLRKKLRMLFSIGGRANFGVVNSICVTCLFHANAPFAYNKTVYLVAILAYMGLYMKSLRYSLMYYYLCLCEIFASSKMIRVNRITFRSLARVQ